MSEADKSGGTACSVGSVVMMSAWGVMHSMSADRSGLKGKTIAADTRRRVWDFARSYRLSIVAFIGTVIVSTFLGLLPPLVIREIFDSAIAERDGGYLNLLFVVLIAAAAGEALLSLVERRLSANIGEGLIFDLRLRLFDHVQRMPLAFFTRTQTGTLVSRLNNDVIGAQRAFTGTLSSVVSNTIVPCHERSWRCCTGNRLAHACSCACRCSIFIRATNGWSGAPSADAPGHGQTPAMNNRDDRASQFAGALLVKLFGRSRCPTTDQLQPHRADPLPRYRVAARHLTTTPRRSSSGLSLVGSRPCGDASNWVGAHLVISGGAQASDAGWPWGCMVVRLYMPLNQPDECPSRL
ncbi:MAG: ABC transporter transmembrane domain-containing protein [Acidimicrobiaceae bacterium]|nr:ABC transporter transmembrane domain-containing protein [Acidimicrobiaceae bacterium]